MDKINNELVYGFEFLWADVLMCLPLEDREKYKRLSKEERERIFNDISNELAKALRTGMMTEWQNIMSTAIGNTNLKEKIREKYYEEDS